MMLDFLATRTQLGLTPEAGDGPSRSMIEEWKEEIDDLSEKVTHNRKQLPSSQLSLASPGPLRYIVLIAYDRMDKQIDRVRYHSYNALNSRHMASNHIAWKKEKELTSLLVPHQFRSKGGESMIQNDESMIEH